MFPLQGLVCVTLVFTIIKTEKVSYSEISWKYFRQTGKHRIAEHLTTCHDVIQFIIQSSVGVGVDIIDHNKTLGTKLQSTTCF